MQDDGASVGVLAADWAEKFLAGLMELRKQVRETTAATKARPDLAELIAAPILAELQAALDKAVRVGMKLCEDIATRAG